MQQAHQYITPTDPSTTIKNSLAKWISIENAFCQKQGHIRDLFGKCPMLLG